MQKSAQDYAKEFMAMLPPGYPPPSPFAVLRASLIIKKQQEQKAAQDKAKGKNSGGALVAAALGIPVAKAGGQWVVNKLTGAEATKQVAKAGAELGLDAGTKAAVQGDSPGWLEQGYDWVARQFGSGASVGGAQVAQSGADTALQAPELISVTRTGQTAGTTGAQQAGRSTLQNVGFAVGAAMNAKAAYDKFNSKTATNREKAQEAIDRTALTVADWWSGGLATLGYDLSQKYFKEARQFKGWAAKANPILGMIGGKDRDQLMRDLIRDEMIDKGIVNVDDAEKSWNVTLADGTTYDIGKDGRSTIKLADGREIMGYNVDWDNATSEQAVSFLNPLLAAFTGGNDKLTSDFVGYLANAAQSQGDDPETIKSNILSFYNQFGLNSDNAPEIFQELFEKEKISEQERDIFTAGVQSLFDGQSGFQIPEIPGQPAANLENPGQPQKENPMSVFPSAASAATFPPPAPSPAPTPASAPQTLSPELLDRIRQIAGTSPAGHGAYAQAAPPSAQQQNQHWQYNPITQNRPSPQHVPQFNPSTMTGGMAAFNARPNPFTPLAPSASLGPAGSKGPAPMPSPSFGPTPELANIPQQLSPQQIEQIRQVVQQGQMGGAQGY